MMTDRDKLADSIRRVYERYLVTLTDEHAARLWRRDRNAIDLGVCPALRLLGGSAWTIDPDARPEDSTPYLLARLAPPDGRSFAITPATAQEVRGLPDASRFAWNGSPID